MKKPIILVVDDEEIVRTSLAEWLKDSGFPVLTAADGFEALNLLYQNEVQVMLTDLKMPEMDGIELMKKARQLIPNLSTIIITAFATIPSAIQAMKEGAFDYLEKPFCPERMELLISKIQAQQEIIEENLRLKQELQKRFQAGDLIGKSPKMQEIFQLIKTVAGSSASVLIQGESGTGKELVARAVHEYSERKDKPFVPVSCASIPETLMESELFGYEKGAFTGAFARKPGCFEMADLGTIFLDEIGEMKPATQVHLLRVLQEKEFRRIGGKEPVKVDVRVLAATNKDLKAEVDKGSFRQDLYYRLNVININLPPLREKKEDILLLAHHFLEKFKLQNKRELQGFAPETKALLLNFDWPGNVRQLENAVEHSVIVSRNEILQPQDLPLELRKAVSVYAGNEEIESLEAMERKSIARALKYTRGNRTQAAKTLGISRQSLYEKIKRYQLSV